MISMANEEHLEILKQGVEVWNQWREENSIIQPNLSGEDFSEENLSGANLSRAALINANLSRTDLSVADLGSADLYLADLSGADLYRANLSRADLSMANLSRASLKQASLGGTNLNQAILEGADLTNALVWDTVFGYVDLSTVKGLETVVHDGPSVAGFGTLRFSRGRIPRMFLQRIGVPEELVNYLASTAGRAVKYHSCFVSYSHRDERFARRLHTDLQKQGVRCWLASEDMKIGDKIRPTIDRAIRLRDKLLLILSEHSINSAWVEKEVETAFEEEGKRSQTVLFPVRLDEAVMETDQAWAADIRRTRHIGDFSQWTDHGAYQQAFERLLRDLKAED